MSYTKYNYAKYILLTFQFLSGVIGIACFYNVVCYLFYYFIIMNNFSTRKLGSFKIFTITLSRIFQGFHFFDRIYNKYDNMNSRIIYL